MFPAFRRLRTSLHVAHRLPRIRGQEQPQAAPARQHGAQGRYRADPCVECQVSNTRGMAERAGRYGWKRRAIPGWDGGWEGGRNGCLSDTPAGEIKLDVTNTLWEDEAGVTEAKGATLSCTQCRCSNRAYLRGYRSGSTALYQAPPLARLQSGVEENLMLSYTAS